MLSRSFTKAELQLNQLKHKQLPPQIDFALLQNGTLQPVHYLIKHEKILPHQKHDSHPILADYGTDQFSIRINDKGNDIVVKLLHTFSFKSVTPFQTKFKTPIKKNNKTLHQQSILLNDTDITSDDEDHIYTRIPNMIPPFQLTKLYKTPNIIQLSKSHHLKLHNKLLLQSMYKQTLRLSHILHRLYPSMILPFSNIKTTFKAFFYLMIVHWT